MNIIFAFIPLVMVLVIVGVFYYFFTGSKKTCEAEKGLKAIYEEQCGGRFNGFNLTIPFVRHTIYPEFVVIAYGNSCHILMFNEIKSVELKSHLLSSGIHYNHKNKLVPMECIIWTQAKSLVINILEEQSVKISKT